MKNNNQSLLNKVREIVEPEYAKIKNWTHGWQHVQSVESNCSQLAKMEGESVVLNGISGYCHDLGRVVEEEKNRVTNGLGVQGHAQLSVEPTRKILTNLGISGEDAYKILEAVGVHSELEYNGDNNIAHILRDADKGDGFGAWGLLRSAGFVLKMDFPVPEWDNKSEIDKRAGEVFSEIIRTRDQKIDGRVSVLDQYKNCIKFNLEWYDMLETNSAKTLFLKDYEFTQKCADRVNLF